MKNYTSKMYEEMKKNPNLSFSGTSHEIASHFVSRPGENSFLAVEAIGITFPDPKYKIRRSNEDVFVLEYIVSGEGSLTVNGQNFKLSSGVAYLIEPNVNQTYYSNPKNPLKKYWINFRSEYAKRIINDLGLSHIYIFEDVNISYYFSELFELENISTINEDIKYKAMGILFSIFMEFKRSIVFGINTIIPQDMLDVKALIDEEKIYNLDELCNRSFISRQTLFKKFKKYYQTSPYQYILKKKIYEACSLLKETNLSITQIAEKLDFTDEFAFSHAFKKSIGIPPNAYRKK